MLHAFVKIVTWTFLKLLHVYLALCQTKPSLSLTKILNSVELNFWICQSSYMDFLNLLHGFVKIDTGCLKKLSFTELSIRRFAMNIISISSQLAAGSPNAQFDKTHFFRHPVHVFL